MLPELINTYQNHTLDSTRWNCYKPRPTDIVISTSLKSGTTWTQEIVRQLIFLGQGVPQHQEMKLGDVSPWLENRWTPIDKLIATLEAQQHRRFIKSHLPLDGLSFFPQVKYIVIGRDPRDVFMSLWNHHGDYTPEFLSFVNEQSGRVGAPMPICPLDIHEFWREWITRGWFEWESEGYPYWGNMHHIKTWWEYRMLPNILFVHYADLLADLTGEIERIADFLAIPLPADALPTICEAVTLDAMRRVATEKNPGNRKIWHGGANTFFFKGINGRWKDMLSADELVLYEEKASRLLTAECRAWLERGRITNDSLS
jgi:aryl sulfotransferase